MVHRDKLVKYVNDFLQIDDIHDYGPQGLQVEGKDKVSTIVTGVSSSVQLFEEAEKIQADLIMVHHGIIWNKESHVIKKSLKKRLRLLLENDMTLLAYHLSLDKHPKIGNNVLAAKKIGLKEIKLFGDIGVQGIIAGCTFDRVLSKVQEVFNSDPMTFPYGPQTIERVGFCSGGAERDISLAIDAGLDAYITGEVSESTMHLAKEGGIHFIAAGHYATERFGIRALGEHVAKIFDVKVQFIDIPNPV